MGGPSPEEVAQAARGQKEGFGGQEFYPTLGLFASGEQAGGVVFWLARGKGEE